MAAESWSGYVRGRQSGILISRIGIAGWGVFNDNKSSNKIKNKSALDYLVGSVYIVV